MNLSSRDLRQGERVQLHSGAAVEAIALTEDGKLILVKYLEAPESSEIAATEDLCSLEEIASWAA